MLLRMFFEGICSFCPFNENVKDTNQDISVIQEVLEISNLRIVEIISE